MEPVAIRLGQVDLYIEPASGQLRYVRVGNYELIRGIYAAVRRSDWGTVVPKISSFDLKSSANQFTCSFSASHQSDDVNFQWEGRIVGKLLSPGQVELEYEFEGVALSGFKTCRTGVCVLHPRSHQGLKAEVEHNQGPCESGNFPKLIKPDQPFKDIKAVSLELAPGVGVRTEFFGEVFEMEDQRNWSDASYKTYCRPQEWGSPYELAKDQKVHHRIKMTIDFPAEVTPQVPVSNKGILPNLGTVVDRTLSDTEIQQLRDRNFGHLLVKQGGLESAKQLKCPIFLLTQTAALPTDMSPSDALALYPPESWQKLNNFRGAKRYATTLGNFVDLNRCRPVFDEIEGIVFSMNPQVHAFDTQTMMECTWTLSDAVETARGFGAKSVVAGPILLKQGGSDARLQGIEAALFTFSAIAHLSKAKADFATFFDSAVLQSSPASLPLELTRDWTSRDVVVWEAEPFFIMIQGEKTILANLSWLPSELFKETPLDLPENLKIGIKGSYRLFTEENIGNWKEVLSGPPSHSILQAMPPRSILVIG